MKDSCVQNEPSANLRFPIVGIGASAGGLEAFTQLLSHLPADTGMAFVLVQHLDPTHASHLRELLSKTTTMPVLDVTDGLLIEPNKVYVIPPNAAMAVKEGRLTLTPRGSERGLHLPVDCFLRSLAAFAQSHAIGVILSGTGSDGALGIDEIKASGGLTFTQDEHSAKFTGMPLSAVKTGSVDCVLPPDGIARKLAEIDHRSYAAAEKAAESEVPQPETEGEYRRFLALLRSASGVDFNGYRESTIRRRIARRMALHRQDSLSDYVRFIEQHRPEAQALYRDVLINVTSFFRDEHVFDALKNVVFPEVIKTKSPESPLRFWTAGCSTGQEAYSLAIVLLEFLSQQSTRPPVQIFATDIGDESSMEQARQGLYPESISSDVSAERLRRFFTKEDAGYRIAKPIRDMVVFAKHNVTTDPPFSKLDLVSCRNVLIYLSPLIQQRIINSFHYALNPGGFLVLGGSESVGRSNDLFKTAVPNHRIYLRKATATRTLPYHSSEPAAGLIPPSGFAGDRAVGVPDLQKEADRIVLTRYAPAGVLVNSDLEILQYRGRTSRYLEPPPGEPNLNLLRMAKGNLFLELRNAVEIVRKTKSSVRRDAIQWREEGQVREINIEILPVRPHGFEEGGFLILFEDAASRNAPAPPPAPPPGEVEQELAQLRKELAEAQDYLQATIEQHGAANEELKSAHEELLSANEELQSTNEELQTAKEELQSTNEELATVNDELRVRNSEIGQVNDDLTNTLSSIHIPVVMLGTDLRIRRFTPDAGKILNLIPTDLGRPISNIRPSFHLPDLEQLLSAVIETMSVREREVQDTEGRWWMLRILPYRTSDHRIDGAVLVLMDIHQIRQAEQQMRESRDFAMAIVDTLRQPLLVLTADRRVQIANRSFYQFFQVAHQETNGQFVHQIGNGQWNHPALRERLDQILAADSNCDDFEINHDFPRIGRKIMLLSTRRLYKEEVRRSLILVAFEDVTERRDAQRLRELTEKLAEANAAKDRFLAALSHELRTPLTPVLMSVSTLDSRADLPADVRDELAVMRRNVGLEARLIDDLLDLNMVIRGKMRMEAMPQNVCELLQEAVRICRADLDAKKMQLDLDLHAARPYVMGDGPRLQQVFWNLIRNAVKFTPTHGQITVRCRNQGDRAIIQVRDTGKGIDPDMLGRVFTPFEQGGTQANQDFGGLGMGLSIAKAIVEQHQGTIYAESKGTDQGATFTVELPVSTEAEQAILAAKKKSPTASSPQAPQIPGLRILVVEDHEASAKMIMRLLENRGHQIVRAGSIESAKQIASQQSFDLVISDLGLPDGSGHDLMRHLKQVHGLRGIALSGYGMEQDRTHSLAAGFLEHLIKPVDFESLYSAIARVSQRQS